MKNRRAYGLFTLKAVSEDRRVITGVATTISPDRDGDIVEPKGAVFKLPLPFLWQHDRTQPIGNVIEARVKANEIEVDIEVVKPTDDMPSQLIARLEEAWSSIKARLVRGLSVGFRPIEYTVLDDTGGLRFTRWEWFELSAVTIPANAQANISTVKSVDVELIALSGNDDQAAPARVRTSPGVPGKKAVSLKTLTPSEGDIMNLKEQIKAAAAKLHAIKTQMDEFITKSADKGETLGDEDQTAYDALKSEHATVSAHLKMLREHEALDAATVEPVTKAQGVTQPTTAAVTPPPSRTVPVQVRNTQVLEKGIRFARYAMCLAQARGNIHMAKAIAENQLKDDDVVNAVLKAAVAAGTTTDAEWAGNLVEHRDLTTDFLEWLRPRTIIGRFGRDGIPSLRRVPFNIHIKGQSAAAAAGWVGEGYAKPVTRMGFSDTYLGWAKVAAISVITEELARFSSPAAEGLVRDELGNAVIERIDTDFVDPVKAAATGAAASPASITNGVTPIVSSGTDAEAVRADIAALWAVADQTNLPVDSAVYITDSRTARMLGLLRNPLGQREFPEVTMRGGSIDGIPVIVSNYVPSDSDGSLFILAFASEILLADDDVVTVEASREASILMDNAPNMNSGTPTGAANMVSMWQTNSIALRAERMINWARRRPQAVAYLTGVNWGVSGS